GGRLPELRGRRPSRAVPRAGDRSGVGAHAPGAARGHHHLRVAGPRAGASAGPRDRRLADRPRRAGGVLHAAPGLPHAARRRGGGPLYRPLVPRLLVGGRGPSCLGPPARRPGGPLPGPAPPADVAAASGDLAMKKLLCLLAVLLCLLPVGSAV